MRCGWPGPGREFAWRGEPMVAASEPRRRADRRRAHRRCRLCVPHDRAGQMPEPSKTCPRPARLTAARAGHREAGRKALPPPRLTLSAPVRRPARPSASFRTAVPPPLLSEGCTRTDGRRPRRSSRCSRVAGSRRSWRRCCTGCHCRFCGGCGCSRVLTRCCAGIAPSPGAVMPSYLGPSDPVGLVPCGRSGFWCCVWRGRIQAGATGAFMASCSCWEWRWPRRPSGKS